MHVLVAGHTGMLGNAVEKYFRHKGAKVDTLPAAMRWPSEEMKSFLRNCAAPVIINCIGGIPQREPDTAALFDLNSRLPLFLFSLTDKKIIHAATDCEFSGSIPPDEFYPLRNRADATDLYGISKAIPAEFILNSRPSNVSMIRASIVGVENGTNKSLLNWFLQAADEGKPLTGFTNHFWNGITTLTWAALAFHIADENLFGECFQPATEKNSKHQLLQIIAAVFDKQVTVTPAEHPKYHNKCLQTTMEIGSIQDMLVRLKDFYNIK